MKYSIAAALWFCVIGLYAVSPLTLPDEPRARRRAWRLLAVAIVVAVAAMAVEASA